MYKILAENGEISTVQFTKRQGGYSYALVLEGTLKLPGRRQDRAPCLPFWLLSWNGLISASFCSIFGKHLGPDRHGLFPVGLIRWSVLNLRKGVYYGEELSIPSRHTFCERQNLGGRSPLIELIQVWTGGIESHMLHDSVSCFLMGFCWFVTVPNIIRASLRPSGFNRGSRPLSPCRNGPCTYKFRSVLNWEVTRAEAGLVVSQKSYFKCLKLNHNSSCPA